MKRTFHLVHAEARRRALEAVREAQDGYIVQVSEPTRNLEQNSALWPALQAFADQLQWPINGKMEFLTKEDWKDILSAAFKRDQARVSPGIDGGMVLLGHRTSKFSKKDFSDFLEFIHATAVARDVDLEYMSYPEAA